jgi:hypothetical protein
LDEVCTDANTWNGCGGGAIVGTVGIIGIVGGAGIIMEPDGGAIIDEVAGPNDVGGGPIGGGAFMPCIGDWFDENMGGGGALET